MSKIIGFIELIVSDVDKKRIREWQSKNGTKKSLDLVLIESDGKYGNDGMIVESVSKEEREKGVKGNIVGKFKYYGTKGNQDAF